MYIVKNALRCISRSKGRNILIGIIVLVIAVSACIGLSIRQAAESAKSDTLDSMTVTATISYDRQSMMSQMGGNGRGDESQGGMPSFDRDQFSQMMGDASALTLEEYLLYAEADSVKDFYYSMTASVNGSDDFLPVSTDTTSTQDEADTATEEQSFPSDMMQGGDFSSGGKGGMGGSMIAMNQTDFTIEGFSSESAMTDFQSGVATVTDGVVFDEGTSEYNCIISEELAIYNSLSVGDTVVITNPNNEEETYTLTVVGLYSDSSANETSFSAMGFSNSDPANKIYMSYNALSSIIESSADSTVTVTDENTGMSYASTLTGSLSGTYVFADTDAYYEFEEQVRELGLDDTYTVSSSDITAFENSLLPLETLSTMAGWFLLVILIIGAVILIVLNIFNVRERKYEIGVLTAMGMKKSKVALQFLTEIFLITITVVILGIIIGGVCSVPVTNALLESQITSQQNQQMSIENNFGRPGEMGEGGSMDMPSDMGGNAPDDIPSDGGGKNFRDMFTDNAVTDYVTEVNSAMNLTVVAQMFGIAVLLTFIAGLASVLFVMRYEPLKILANRD